MTAGNNIRVMLVDDHDMVRSGLVVFLEAYDDLQLVAEARNGEEALRQCEKHRPDVILMDLVMPRMDGVEATRVICERYPDVQVIGLTSFKDESLVHAVLDAGAISYLSKDVSIDELAEAIRAAHAGRSTLTRAAIQALLAARRRPPGVGHDLTEREMEVLALIVEGLTNPAIAVRLGVSRSTIKTHVSNVLAKLDATNRLEAARIAIEQGLLE